MKKIRLCSIAYFAFMVSTFAIAQGDVRVILTGNTADLESNSALFTVLNKYCSEKTSPLLWVLNGDIFPPTFSDVDITLWQTEVNTMLDRYPQLQILINQGDRDWDDSKKDGWKKIQSLEKLLMPNKHARFHLYFQRGCPGPWTFTFAPHVELVILNSQWWNHPFEKPIPSTGVCEIADTDIFVEEFEGILDEADKKNIMILSHFPLESIGNHGGRFPFSAHLIPPVVGSALVGFHQNVGTSKDISNIHFDPIRYKLDGVLQNYSSLIFASAHDANQSIIKSGQNFYINSGSIDAPGFAASGKQALLSSSKPGIIEITYKADGEVAYQYYQTRNHLVEKGQEGVLFYSECGPSTAQPKNTTYTPCSEKILQSGDGHSDLSKPTQAIAGPDYASSKFKQRWLGKHYRASWTTKVTVPFLNMDTTRGGLIVNGRGGGRQTTSLKMSGEDGREYVFRSVDKDPSKALPFELRGTIVSEVLKDQTTTQQPYGALAVSPWLDKLQILHATPSLFVLPDDKALGPFRESYRNLFGMLEVRPSDKIDEAKVFGGARDIEKSFKMFDKLYRDHDNKVAKPEFIRARVFDLWIGDWSKHEDNWKWAGYKEGKGEIFRPIPRDRDHAFSRWDGIIPWLGDREWAMPNGENFDSRIKGLRSLMWQARHLDRFVASDITKEQWIAAARDVQTTLSDKDIEEGIKRMPSEIYLPDGKEIEDKLKIRKKDLPRYAEEYYYMLAREVDVVGSNKEEYFHALRNNDGSVTVTVYDINEKQQPDTSNVYYKRKFYLTETREIRLFGLMDDDVFVVEGTAEKSILIRVISGGGHDTIIDKSLVKKGSSRTLVYEKEEDAKIDLGSEGKKVVPAEDEYYQYDRAAFKYNTYMPQLLFSYNPFTGAAIQGGVTFTRQRFAKPDFSSRHRLKGSVSVQGNYEFSYANQFRYLIGKWDGVTELMISRPLNYNFFFGIGNNTIQDDEQSKDYYRAQYNLASVSAGLVRNFWSQSKIAFIASYEIAEGIKRSNSYLADHPEVFGVERVNLLFLKGIVDLDFRDRTALPEHGFRLLFNQYAGNVSGTDENLATVSELELENYFSTYSRNPLTVGLKLGGGVTDGTLPFYKLFSIGQMNNLQGFKRNRFTGQSEAFLNSEIRWQITETRNTLVPLKMGVRGFFDIARVWAETDNSADDYWHYGYGGGFYVTPFREQFSFNISAGRSKEESLLLMISVGSFFR